MHELHLPATHRGGRDGQPSLTIRSGRDFEHGSQYNLLHSGRRLLTWTQFLGECWMFPNLVCLGYVGTMSVRASQLHQSSFQCHSPPISSISVIASGQGGALSDLYDPRTPLLNPRYPGCSLWMGGCYALFLPGRWAPGFGTGSRLSDLLTSSTRPGEPSSVYVSVSLPAGHGQISIDLGIVHWNFARATPPVVSRHISTLPTQIVSFVTTQSPILSKPNPQ